MRGSVRMLRIPLALAVVALLALPPLAQGSVHGVDWVATGVATDGSNTFLAELKWNGCFGCFFGLYTMTLTPTSGGAPAATQFNGYENVNEHTGFSGNWFYAEISGSSATAGIQFSLAGEQFGSTVPNPTHILSNVLSGTFQGKSFTVATPPSAYTIG
ncbi:MAG: hypothetical protein LC624_04100 [Halobacteriales archaeon]|nr:hypothetical protein [Halobacteriales archaeon]